MTCNHVFRTHYLACFYLTVVIEFVLKFFLNLLPQLLNKTRPNLLIKMYNRNDSEKAIILNLTKKIKNFLDFFAVMRVSNQKLNLCVGIYAPTTAIVFADHEELMFFLSNPSTVNILAKSYIYRL